MNNQKPWTYPEIERLRQLAPTTPLTALAEALGRTVDSVRMKAYSCGVNIKPHANAAKPWLSSEIKTLRDGAGKATTLEIAGLLCRTEHAVQLMARRLGVSLCCRDDYKRWTEGELIMLNAVERPRDLPHLADVLGRSLSSVTSRYQRERRKEKEKRNEIK